MCNEPFLSKELQWNWIRSSEQSSESGTNISGTERVSPLNLFLLLEGGIYTQSFTCRGIVRFMLAEFPFDSLH